MLSSIVECLLLKCIPFWMLTHCFRICSSGFYHDPVAGWYYCSKDGLYYKHEKGEYVPLEHDESNVNPLVHIVTSEDAQAEALLSDPGETETPLGTFTCKS